RSYGRRDRPHRPAEALSRIAGGRSGGRSRLPECPCKAEPTVRAAVRSRARVIVGSEANTTAASAAIRSIGIVLSFNPTMQQLTSYYNAKQPAFNLGSVEGRFQPPCDPVRRSISARSLIGTSRFRPR